MPGDVRPAVPDHEVLRRIGRGSYGEIWLARALATGAWRAVKIVWRINFESERSFRREFEGMTVFEPISRSHAGFVDILQVGRNDALGFFYYVMELADDHATGLPLADPAAYAPRTLRAVLQERRRLWPPECLTLGASLAEALGALHAHGLSHRDIKPDNIIFVGGEPKLADIGLVAAHGNARSSARKATSRRKVRAASRRTSTAWARCFTRPAWAGTGSTSRPSPATSKPWDPTTGRCCAG